MKQKQKILEQLLLYQNSLLQQVSDDWHRYLFHVFDKEDRLTGIKGLRGVGKTTMLLQYLAFHYPNRRDGLYVTADHPYFYERSLLDLATEWELYGGRLLLIDEIHKYPGWSQQIKLIYDGLPGLRVIFTGSSALELYKGEADLSRRLISHTLRGLSFREYLSFYHDQYFEKHSLEEILKGHEDIASQIVKKVKILPLFVQYLEHGYFPFFKEMKGAALSPRLLQVINTVLESDLGWIEDYSAANIEKIKKLLGVIAQVAPFEPNISRIAEKLKMGRNTLYIYLKNLKDAGIINLLNKPGRGIAVLQKPGKIYFENTAYAYAFQHTPQAGTLRETFFVNQLVNAGYMINLSPEKADFLVDEKYTFEVGGRNKGNSQIRNIKDSYKALDNIENGFLHTIPLWLFGFLY